MSFNPDHTKPVLQVVFSRKIDKIDRPLLVVNNAFVKHVPPHRHFVPILDSKTDFSKHLNSVFSKAHKKIASKILYFTTTLSFDNM